MDFSNTNSSLLLVKPGTTAFFVFGVFFSECLSKREKNANTNLLLIPFYWWKKIWKSKINWWEQGCVVVLQKSLCFSKKLVFPLCVSVVWPVQAHSAHAGRTAKRTHLYRASLNKDAKTSVEPLVSKLKENTNPFTKGFFLIPAISRCLDEIQLQTLSRLIVYLFRLDIPDIYCR